MRKYINLIESWDRFEQVANVISKYFDIIEERNENHNGYFLINDIIQKIHFSSTIGPVFGSGFKARIIFSDGSETIVTSPIFPEFLEKLDNQLREINAQ